MRGGEVEKTFPQQEDTQRKKNEEKEGVGG